MAAFYRVPVGAGHAREQKGAGIGFLMVPEHKKSPAWQHYARDRTVARMAASYKGQAMPAI